MSLRPVKRSFSIRGHRTSISLEEAFWRELKEAAEEERTSIAALIASIDHARGASGLSSAVRVWLLDRLRTKLAALQSEGRNGIEPQ